MEVLSLQKSCGLELINSLAETYAWQHLSGGNALLDEIDAYTRLHHPKAHMLSGKLQGRLLASISRMLRPLRVLEIGTFTGYSALCLAEGLGAEGRLHSIEKREQDLELARSFIQRSVWRDHIILHAGNALDIIPSLPETWDLVFLDADKVHYADYYEMVLPVLRPGGWILADNVFFHGEVLKEPLKGKNAKAIHAFNEQLRTDGRVEILMLTIRDGLMLIRKKNEE